jgi:transcription elongation factor GreA
MAAPRRTRTVTAAHAVEEFLQTLPSVVRDENDRELSVFLNWYGADRALKELKPEAVSSFAKQFGASAPDPVKRLAVLRAFLTFARTQGYVTRDLTGAVRIADEFASTRLQAARPAGMGVIRLTPEGYHQLQAELEALKAQRPQIAHELDEARSSSMMEDTQEVDWVRHYQALLESRIGELEGVLRRAEVLRDEEVPEDRVGLGSTVVLRDLDTGREFRFLIVDSPEARPSQGKISTASPTGQALLNHEEGDLVEVHAPAGIIRYRIEAIERRGHAAPSEQAA